jgi:hypothetical protein
MIAHIIAFFIASFTVLLALDTRFTFEQALYATAVNMVLAHSFAAFYNVVKWLAKREWGANLLNTAVTVIGVCFIAVLAPLIVCALPLLPVGLIGLAMLGRSAAGSIALHKRLGESVKNWT